MAYGESNSNMIRDLWPHMALKGQGHDPSMLRSNIWKTAGDVV